MHTHTSLRAIPAIARLAAVRRELHARQLARVIEALAAREDAWRPLVRHDPHRRWYERVVHTGAIEIWLIGWAPGQGTPIHDHAGANGAFVVVEGELTEDVYAGASLEAPRRHARGAGSALPLGVDHIHSVTNLGTANATSIHAYSPPDLPMHVLGPARALVPAS